MRTFWAGTLPLVLMAGVLVATPQVLSPAVAEAAPATTLSPANPIKLERFNYYSGQPTAFVRPVVLQKKVGNSWRTIYSGNTGANGRFRFTVHTASVDTLRSYSAAYRYRGKTYPASATAPITVRPRGQKISLTMGSTTTAYVDSTPGRAGRTITLQRQTGRAWTTVKSTRTTSSGMATITIPSYNRRATYRAIASPWNGAPAGVTPLTTRSTAAPGLVVTPSSQTVTNAAQLRSLRLSPDLTAFLIPIVRKGCGSYGVTIHVSKFRMNDAAKGDSRCQGPDSSGWISYWYKSSGRWHEYSTQYAAPCGELIRDGVPRTAVGFFREDCRA